MDTAIRKVAVIAKTRMDIAPGRPRQVQVKQALQAPVLEPCRLSTKLGSVASSATTGTVELQHN